MPSKKQRVARRERCMHCQKHEPVWLVLDSKQHTYLDTKGNATKQQDAYLICGTCRQNLVRQNRRSRKPRKLTFMRWDVDASAEAG